MKCFLAANNQLSDAGVPLKETPRRVLKWFLPTAAVQQQTVQCDGLPAPNKFEFTAS